LPEQNKRAHAKQLFGFCFGFRHSLIALSVDGRRKKEASCEYQHTRVVTSNDMEIQTKKDEKFAYPLNEQSNIIATEH